MTIRSITSTPGMDADGTILFQSPTIEAALGISAKALIGRPCVELIAPDDRPLLGVVLEPFDGDGVLVRQLIRSTSAERHGIRPGDVIWFPPDERHWHGAAPDTAMTHIAIQEALDGSNVTWEEHVSDADYSGILCDAGRNCGSLGGSYKR